AARAVAAAGAAEAPRRRRRAQCNHGGRARRRRRPACTAAGAVGCGAAAPLSHGDRNAMSFGTVELEELRRRRSEKWRKFPPDVLPSHIAEMDFAVAPPVEEALVA